MNISEVLPFNLHSQAFAAEAKNDLETAEKFYRLALKLFAHWITTPPKNLASIIFEKDEVIKALLEDMPQWLFEVHLQRSQSAYERGELNKAAMHWRLFEYQKYYRELLPPAYIEKERTKINNLKFSDKRIYGSIEQRKSFIDEAETFLQVDLKNQELRNLLLQAYQLQLDYFQKLENWKSNKAEALETFSPPDGFNNLSLEDIQKQQNLILKNYYSQFKHYLNYKNQKPSQIINHSLTLAYEFMNQGNMERTNNLAKLGTIVAVQEKNDKAAKKFLKIKGIINEYKKNSRKTQAQ